MRVKGKRPTVAQKKILDAAGYNSDFCLVTKVFNERDGIDTLHIVDSETGDESVVRYNRKAPTKTVEVVA